MQSNACRLLWSNSKKIMGLKDRMSSDLEGFETCESLYFLNICSRFHRSLRVFRIDAAKEPSRDSVASLVEKLLPRTLDDSGLFETNEGGQPYHNVGVRHPSP